MTSSLFHPKLLTCIYETTLLVSDVIDIVGEYWIPLHIHRKGRHEFYYESEDVYQCLDGKEMEIIKSNAGGFCVLLHTTYWCRDEVDVLPGSRLMHCSLGQISNGPFIFRLLTSDTRATWKTSNSLTKLLRWMPVSQYNKFLEVQHSCQSQELEI